MNFIDVINDDYEHFSQKIKLMDWKFKCFLFLRDGKFNELKIELNQIKSQVGYPKSFFQNNKDNDRDGFVSLSNMIYSKIDERMDELDASQEDLVKVDFEKHLFSFNRVIHQEEELAKEEKVAIEMACMAIPKLEAVSGNVRDNI